MGSRRDLFAPSNNSSNSTGQSGGYVNNHTFYQSTGPPQQHTVYYPPQQHQSQSPVAYGHHTNAYYASNHNNNYTSSYAAPPAVTPMMSPPPSYQQHQQHQSQQQSLYYPRDNSHAQLPKQEQPAPPLHWNKTLSTPLDTQRPPTAVSPHSASSTTTSSSSSSSTTSDTTSTNSDVMWDARRARERAEAAAEQKLIDAVCKASLLEFTERENALVAYENALVASATDHSFTVERLADARTSAEARKRVAMQRVIDSKQTAQRMAAQARTATELYTNKNAERLAKQAAVDELNEQEARTAALAVAQATRDAAIRKREDAEQRALAAREKAEAMRQRAIAAATAVRMHARQQIESEMTHDETNRQFELQRALDALERDRNDARERRQAAAQKAIDAQQKAAALQVRADHARQQLNASSSSVSSNSAPAVVQSSSSAA